MMFIQCRRKTVVNVVSALFFWTLWFPSPPARGQEAGSQEQQVQTPQPISVAEIPGRSELAIEELRSMGEDLTVSPAVTAIDSLFPTFLAKIRRQENAVTDAALEHQTLRGLSDRFEQWTRYASQLSEWRQELEDRARQLEEIRFSLQRMRSQWEATLSSSKEEEIPNALRRTIDAVLASIATQETALQERRSEVLALLERISDASLRVTANLRDISEALSGFSRKLLEQDSPPLWELIAGTEAPVKGEELATINQRKLETIQDYFTGHKTVLVLTVASAVLVLLILFLLRRKSTTLLASEAPGQAREVPLVLRRPISTTIVVTSLIAWFAAPGLPSVVTRLAGLIMLFPLLRLLPLYFPRFVRRVLYTLSGLFVLHRFEALSIDVPLLYRGTMLLLTLCGIAAVIWFDRSLVRQTAESGISRQRWHLWISRGALVLLAVSLVSNLLGAVSFAELLTDGTLNSLYSVMALTAGVLVFGDLFDLLLRTHAGQSLRMVRDSQETLSRQWAKALRLAAVLLWVIIVLSNFDLWTPVKTLLAQLLAQELTLGSWSFTIGGILGLLLTVWISVMLSRFVRFALATDVLPRTSLHRGLQSTISTMGSYLILLAGLALATSMIGIHWDTIAIIIGALGVGIGFGLQNLVNNFVSGLILLLERPINVGDTIEFGSRFGDVLRIGLRASTVRTFDGSEVIVPNASLVSSEVVNWTLSDRNRRMEISVGVEYGSDPQKVLDLLLGVVRKHPLVMKVPEPFAWFMGFGDSSLDFVVKFWCQFENAFTARSEIMTATNKALAEAGIVIPFPQRDLHLRSINPQITGAFPTKKDSPP